MSHQHTVTPLYIAITAGIGMFLSTLDSGIINIALPSLMQVFNAKLNMLIWAVTLYTLVLSASILLFGQLADRFGRLTIYRLGLLFFAVSSLLCGLSSNAALLITFRALQGLSAAMMQATAIALITATVEESDRAKALGVLGIILGLGPLLGPVLGGVILSSVGWRWIFWLNIPICLYAIVACAKLKLAKEVLHSQPLNYLNLALIGLSMFLLLLSMNYVHKNFQIVTVSIIVAWILMFIFSYCEKNAKSKIMDYRLFKNKGFTVAILGIMGFGAATAITFILPPLYFMTLRHYEPWQIGLISLSAPLGLVISAQISVRLMKLFGAFVPMLSGMIIMVIPLLVLTTLQINWPVAVIFILLLCYGLGGGLYISPNYTHLTSYFPTHRQASISALIRLFQNMAITFGAAGSAMLIHSKPNEVSSNLILGIQHGWWFAATLIIIGLMALLYQLITTRMCYATR